MVLKKHMKVLCLVLITCLSFIPHNSAAQVTPPPSPPPSGLTKLDQGEVYIDKITNKSNGEYHKGDYIKVILKIRTNHENAGEIKEVSIHEDILEEFDLIEIKPGYKSHYIPESRTIVWNFSDLRDLIITREISYIIKTNTSGEYTLGTTELSAKKKNNVNIYIYPSPDINIINRPPSISNVTYTHGTIWQGDCGYIHAIVDDPDGDDFSCELWSNGCQLIKWTYEYCHEGRCYYTWDLSNCNAGLHRFTLKANDTDNGISEIGAGELEITKKLFGVLPIPDENKWPMLTGLIGVIAGIIISNISLVWTNIKPLIRRKNHQKDVEPLVIRDKKQIIDLDTKNDK